jgi:hypothetical protein
MYPVTIVTPDDDTPDVTPHLGVNTTLAQDESLLHIPVLDQWCGVVPTSYLSYKPSKIKGGKTQLGRVDVDAAILVALGYGNTRESSGPKEPSSSSSLTAARAPYYSPRRAVPQVADVLGEASFTPKAHRVKITTRNSQVQKNSLISPAQEEEEVDTASSIPVTALKNSNSTSASYRTHKLKTVSKMEPTSILVPSASSHYMPILPARPSPQQHNHKRIKIHMGDCAVCEWLRYVRDRERRAAGHLHELSGDSNGDGGKVVWCCVCEAKLKRLLAAAALEDNEHVLLSGPAEIASQPVRGLSWVKAFEEMSSQSAATATPPTVASSSKTSNLPFKTTLGTSRFLEHSGRAAPIRASAAPRSYSSDCVKFKACKACRIFRPGCYRCEVASSSATTSTIALSSETTSTTTISSTQEAPKYSGRAAPSRPSTTASSSKIRIPITTTASIQENVPKHSGRAVPIRPVAAPRSYSSDCVKFKACKSCRVFLPGYLAYQNASISKMSAADYTRGSYSHDDTALSMNRTSRARELNGSDGEVRTHKKKKSDPEALRRSSMWTKIAQEDVA